MSNSVDNTDDTIKDEARIEAESEKAFEGKEVTLRRRITRPESDTEGEGKSCERERIKQETNGNSRNEKRPTTDAGQPEHGSPSNNTKREEEEAVQDLPGKVALDVTEKENPTLAARPIPGHDPTQTDAPSQPRAASYKIIASVAIVTTFLLIGANLADLRKQTADLAEANKEQQNKIKGLEGANEAFQKRIKGLESAYEIVHGMIGQLQTHRHRTITDCSEVSPTDAKVWNGTGGTFNIYHQQTVIQVFCDLKTDGGGWLVIQRRMDGSVDFYRNWNDYREGFGEITGEFWLGLQKIHEITSSDNYELRIDMEDWGGNKRYATYRTIRVGDEKSKFQLTVVGYTGDAGDSLSHHNLMKFSTHDRDFDISDGNCAKSFKGAWWFRSCYMSHLNGYYFIGGDTSYREAELGASSPGGIKWKTWREKFYSLKFSEMKIRKLYNRLN